MLQVVSGKNNVQSQANKDETTEQKHRVIVKENPPYNVLKRSLAVSDDMSRINKRRKVEKREGISKRSTTLTNSPCEISNNLIPSSIKDLPDKPVTNHTGSSVVKLSDLPAEVWHGGIYRHLDARTLLSLARTSKGFYKQTRSTLLQKKLIDACHSGRENKVEIALQAGAQADIQGPDGAWPLVAALYSVKMPVIRCLEKALGQRCNAMWTILKKQVLEVDLYQMKSLDKYASWWDMKIWFDALEQSPWQPAPLGLRARGRLGADDPRIKREKGQWHIVNLARPCPYWIAHPQFGKRPEAGRRSPIPGRVRKTAELLYKKWLISMEEVKDLMKQYGVMEVQHVHQGISCESLHRS